MVKLEQKKKICQIHFNASHHEYNEQSKPVALHR